MQYPSDWRVEGATNSSLVAKFLPQDNISNISRAKKAQQHLILILMVRCLKMKDDAIAHLLDQLIALTTRLDTIEKRQR